MTETVNSESSEKKGHILINLRARKQVCLLHFEPVHLRKMPTSVENERSVQSIFTATCSGLSEYYNCKQESEEKQC